VRHECQAKLYGVTGADGKPVSLEILILGEVPAPPTVRFTWHAGDSVVIDEWLANYNDSALALRKLAATAQAVRQWTSKPIEIVGSDWLDRIVPCVCFSIDIGNIVFRAPPSLGRIYVSINQFLDESVFRRWLLVTSINEVENFGSQLASILETWGDWDP
jgi:hypothetical protein